MIDRRAHHGIDGAERTAPNGPRCEGQPAPAADAAPRLLVLGLGNPILSDDGVGLRVVQAAREECQVRGLADGVEFRERCTGGLDLLFELDGFDAAIVADSHCTGEHEPGRVRRLAAAEMGAADLAGVQDHWLTLPAAVALGQRLGRRVPTRLAAVVVEVGEGSLEFGESLSRAVAAAVPAAVREVCDLVRQWTESGQPTALGLCSAETARSGEGAT